MSGSHRSTTQTPVASALKSVVWLVKLTAAVGAMLLQVAVAAFVCYTVITQPRTAWPIPLLVSFGILVSSGVLGNILLRRARRATARPSGNQAGAQRGELFVGQAVPEEEVGHRQ